MGARAGVAGLGITHPSVIAAIFGFTIFGFIWIFLVVPTIESQTWFLQLPPIIAYPIYILGIFLMVLGIFGFLLGAVVHGARFNHLKGLAFGLIGFSALEAFDLLNPPFYLSPNGQILVPLGTSALENTSADATVAYVWSSLFPFLVQANIAGYSLLYIFTYLVTFVLIIFVALALTASQFFPSLLFRLFGFKGSGR